MLRTLSLSLSLSSRFVTRVSLPRGTTILEQVTNIRKYVPSFSSSSSSSFFNINYRMEFRSSPNGWWCGLFFYGPNVWRWGKTYTVLRVYFLLSNEMEQQCSQIPKLERLWKTLNKCIVSALSSLSLSTTHTTDTADTADTDTAKWVMDSNRFSFSVSFHSAPFMDTTAINKKTTTTTAAATWKGPKGADDNLSALSFHWIKEKGLSFIHSFVRSCVSLGSLPGEPLAAMWVRTSCNN